MVGEGDGGEGKCTFDGVGGFVLTPVAEDFVFDPGHVRGVVFIVFLLGPVGHGCGWCLVVRVFKAVRSCKELSRRGFRIMFSISLDDI